MNPELSAEYVVWTVETMEDDRESYYYTHSVHASFASADLLLKQLAQEYPEWIVRTRAWTLLNDGTGCDSALSTESKPENDNTQSDG